MAKVTESSKDVMSSLDGTGEQEIINMYNSTDMRDSIEFVKSRREAARAGQEEL